MMHGPINIRFSEYIYTCIGITVLHLVSVVFVYTIPTRVLCYGTQPPKQLAILSASPRFLHQVLLSFIGLRPRGLKTFIKIDITLISIKINYFEDLNSHCIWAETSVAYLQNVKFLLH